MLMIRGIQWNTSSSLMNEAIKKRSTDVNLQKLTSFQDDRGRHFDFTTATLTRGKQTDEQGCHFDLFVCVCLEITPSVRMNVWPQITGTMCKNKLLLSVKYLASFVLSECNFHGNALIRTCLQQETLNVK